MVLLICILGTKYEFKAVYFQGPEFSPIDVEFLELRDRKFFLQLHLAAITDFCNQL